MPLSPAVRRLVEENNLNPAAIRGTGVDGRLTKADVLTHMKGAPATWGPAAAPAQQMPRQQPRPEDAAREERVPMSKLRQVIASRLTASARDIPHFNISADVEIDKLLAARKDLNGRDGADYKISVNDFVIKAVAVALRRCPDVNVAYTDDAILKFNRADVSVAVAIEGGLITPIIKDAGSLGLAGISAKAKELAGKARDGKLQPEEFQGGTFTISNLGMFGVKSFNSIINPPQAAILSVGAGEQRAVVKDGALAVATVMSLTLAVDHRCIDGATAAGFIKELKAILEDPISLLL